MSKLIKFIPFVKDKSLLRYAETPKSASNFIPDWWKKQELKVNDSEFDNLSFKSCVPFLDSLISGYMIYTNQDILVSLEDQRPKLTWTTLPEPLVFRGDSKNLPVPAGHFPDHFAWQIHFGFVMPKGYSALLTHPLNRFDLPFTSVSGIVDDEMPWAGQFTFWVKNDFQGIIPKGTPIGQIIPFKREDWKSQRSDDLVQYALDKLHEKSTIRGGYYKKFMHKKKKFE